MSVLLRIATAAVLVAGFLSTPGFAAMDRMQKQEVEKIVHDYLLANPEVLDEAFKALQDKRQKETLAKQAETIAKSSDLLFKSPNQMVLGNPDGVWTVIDGALREHHPTPAPPHQGEGD